MTKRRIEDGSKKNQSGGRLDGWWKKRRKRRKEMENSDEGNSKAPRTLSLAEVSHIRLLIL